MPGALDGIKVLDFTQVYSGPFCTLMLRDLGAEIIKIERPGGGDIVRNDSPLTVGCESGTFIILNRGKKSITLDIKSEKGHRICLGPGKKSRCPGRKLQPRDQTDKLGPWQPGDLQGQSPADIRFYFSLRPDRSASGLSGV